MSVRLAEASRPALTVQDVATRMNVGDDTVRKWINSDQLVAYKLPGGKKQPIYRILQSDFESFCDAHRTIERRRSKFKT